MLIISMFAKGTTIDVAGFVGRLNPAKGALARRLGYLLTKSNTKAMVPIPTGLKQAKLKSIIICHVLSEQTKTASAILFL